jgi:hypothetical protein
MKSSSDQVLGTHRHVKSQIALAGAVLIYLKDGNSRSIHIAKLRKTATAGYG